MEKLPLRPLFFVPAYLLLGVVSFFLTAPGLEISSSWLWLIGLGSFALQFVWIFRALAFASGRLRSMGRGVGVSDPLNTARRFFLMMVLSFGAVALYKEYLQPAMLEGTSFEKPLEMLLVLPTLYFFLGIHWISARTLCEAELGGKASTNGIIGTFLLFFYLVIGAPFIYRRLKKLRELSPVGIAEPA